jgi:hypothetical protein
MMVNADEAETNDRDTKNPRREQLVAILNCPSFSAGGELNPRDACPQNANANVENANHIDA